MKYIVVLCDGMADFPIKELNGKTPLQVACKPNIDKLAKTSELGMVKTIPDGMKPGSDTANLAVMGYNPEQYYSGRSPLEAASIGVKLKDTDVTLRANLVTLSADEPFENKTMIDYSAGEISTKESTELINYLKPFIDTDELKLYSGVSYRHLMVVEQGKICGDLTPPHDITGKQITEHLPKSETGKKYLEIMKKSNELLKNHPLNAIRRAAGKNTAESLWFWGEGTKPKMDLFYDKYGKKGGVISAVDLLKGIGILAGMEIIDVEGATGNYDTNFLGKAKACINALENGLDFVYIHMEAPDECGHHGDLKHKIYSIEQIDKYVVGTILNELKEDYSLLILPDHPTPITTMTHSGAPVPYMIYRSNVSVSGRESYDENTCSETGLFEPCGYKLMSRFLK